MEGAAAAPPRDIERDRGRTRGRRLRAGEVVLTGSLIVPFAAESGDDIRIEFEGLGSVAISFAEAT